MLLGAEIKKDFTFHFTSPRKYVNVHTLLLGVNGNRSDEPGHAGMPSQLFFSYAISHCLLGGLPAHAHSGQRHAAAQPFLTGGGPDGVRWGEEEISH